MRKWFIGMVLVLTLGSIGTTYAYWNQNLTVHMRTATGSFDFRFGGEASAEAVVVDPKDRELEVIDGLEMNLSADGKEAELLFTRELPLEWLLDGNFIRIRYPLEWEDGAVFPKTAAEPDFAQPAEQVAMTGKVKGLSMDGSLFEFPGAAGDYELLFESFSFAHWDEDVLYGTIYLGLSEEAVDSLDSLADTVFEVSEEELLEADGEIVWDSGQQGLVVEYSGRLSICLDQMNEAALHGDGG